MSHLAQSTREFHLFDLIRSSQVNKTRWSSVGFHWGLSRVFPYSATTTVQISATVSVVGKGKGKVNHVPQESMGSAHLPLPDLEPVGGLENHYCLWRVASATPDGYLPSSKASLPIGWYQIILIGDRGTSVLTTCPGLHSTVRWLGFEPENYWSQVWHPTAMSPICCWHVR